MKISILTIFPEFFDSFMNSSIIQRSVARGLIEIELINIRDFSKSKTRRIDDHPIGGGPGLVMQLQPIVDALASIRTKDSHIVLLSPRGRTFKQGIARDFTKYEHLILLCGHYEGVDARIENYINEEISIGDYIVAGGEYGALIITDAVNRLLEGSIRADSTVEESFENSLLEYSQYAPPYDFQGHKVPDILYSGNHKAIARYRHKEALKITQRRRPDLLIDLSVDDLELLNEEDVSNHELKIIKKSSLTKK